MDDHSMPFSLSSRKTSTSSGSGTPYSASVTIVSSGEYRRAPFPIGTLGAKEVDSPFAAKCSFCDTSPKFKGTLCSKIDRIIKSAILPDDFTLLSIFD